VADLKILKIGKVYLKAGQLDKIILVVSIMIL